jgi:hypothetical protein
MALLLRVMNTGLSTAVKTYLSPLIVVDLDGSSPVECLLYRCLCTPLSDVEDCPLNMYSEDFCAESLSHLTAAF